MSIIDIEIAKNHLRVDDGDDGDLIQMYLDGAEDAAEQFLNRRVFKDADALQAAVIAGNAGELPIVMTPSMKNAVLLILGDLYANREDTVIGTIVASLPRGAQALLQPYRVQMGV
ncbi:head-tail connector protein [Oxalicibacterium faecigallinarum]|uniref:Phage gp6-like head-tail connector protein n=1 Tax=Oxalicibacterium faecigallinarum TaxID=573741 RepID=A0A8J3AL50_9BURK|nr:head-tail connector protein [Oxalicibacterium faecigallinarum]GGI16438.1 hypothetical protein GCM10008066_03960 [Oxalicibacterium faecigallinarum]